MLGQTESVGLATMRNRVEQWLAPAAGQLQLARVIQILDEAQPTERPTCDCNE